MDLMQMIQEQAGLAALVVSVVAALKGSGAISGRLLLLANVALSFSITVLIAAAQAESDGTSVHWMDTILRGLATVFAAIGVHGAVKASEKAVARRT